MEDFVTLTRHLFGLEVRRHRDGRSAHVYSRRLGLFLAELGLPLPLHAGNKCVPAALFRCPAEEIAAFLAGYLDGDGHASSRQLEISAVTKSETLADDLQALCARLGAVAFVRPVQSRVVGRWSASRTYFQVSTTGADAARLHDLIALRHPRKRARLAAQTARFRSGKQASNWDTVPFDGDQLHRVRTGLGMSRRATGRQSSVQTCEEGRGELTARLAREVVGTFLEAGRDCEFGVPLAWMQRLASADLAWDAVESLAEIPATGVELYDVTVPDAGCFLGNGLVLHNCHIYTTTTGAMKNAFGGLLNTKRHYTHSWIHATLVDLLAIQKEIHSGLFAVMDGTTAGNGPGPRTMFPVVKNFMLASTDQVAIDAVAAKMMGFDPMTLDYIRLAHEAGLGSGKPADIDVVGDDVSGENWHFHVGDNGASRIGDLLWFGPLKSIQNFFFRTPLVNAFILGSEVYHDFYRWPLCDRAAFERWRRDTAWGQLFQRYATGGPLREAAPAAEEPR